MDQLVSRGRGNVGKVMKKILEVHYPGEAKKITFEDLLKCDAWQTFLKIYGRLYYNSCFQELY